MGGESLDVEERSLNSRVSARLDEMADLLEHQGANPFRVQAYRRAAETINKLDDDVEDLVAGEGRQGLLTLPWVGKAIASAIEEMVHTGRWNQLDRVRGALEPEKLFQSIPGVGPELAHRIHETLHVDTLEALETAVMEGRATEVEGVGPGRSRLLKASLSQMLQRTRRHRTASPVEPSVEVLLEVDREYRRKAERDELRKITPRRFNPGRVAWLPILHTFRGSYHFTVLFSNTGRAHEVGRVGDWVVIYFHTDDQSEGQRTVVTETRGPLEGKRVVRGRESECHDFYGQSAFAK
jgi:hypothetical protein